MTMMMMMDLCFFSVCCLLFVCEIGSMALPQRVEERETDGGKNGATRVACNLVV
jgi:hypothetical protein